MKAADRLLGLLAGVTLAGWLGVIALSHRFRWGEGQCDRPILAVLALLAALWVAYGLAIGAAGASRLSRRPPVRPGIVLAFGLAVHVMMIGTSPIQEHDAYRYLWEGASFAEGMSPYRFAPADVLRPPTPSDPADLWILRELRDDDPDAAATLTRVGYPDIPTIYPPVAQVAFAVAYRVGGWSWDGLRLVLIAAYFLGAFAIVRAVATESGVGSGVVASVLLGWCPLTIKEVGNSAHVDALVFLWLGGAMLLAGRHSKRPAAWIPLATGGLLGLGILTKLYPLILVPVFAAWMLRRSGRRDAVLLAVGTLASTAAGFAPFLWVDGVRVFDGLITFGGEWRRNPGLFDVIETMARHAARATIRWAPSWPGSAEALASTIARSAAGTATLAAALWTAARLRTATVGELGAACGGVLAVWFLLLPMAFPWYLIGLLPFVALSPSMPTRALAPVLMASVTLGYYLQFWTEYRALPEAYGSAIRMLEYGIPLALALAVALGARRPVAAGAARHPNPVPWPPARIGVIIPARNEKDNIESAVTAAAAVGLADDRVRVVVCDNGSSDGTAERAASAGAEIVTEPRRGYGSACLAGLAHLGSWPDVILFYDADAASPLPELRRILGPVCRREAELSIGARIHAEAGSLTTAQRWGNRLATLLIRLVWGRRFFDLGPVRAARRDALEGLGLTDRTWGWNVEMQVLSLRRGLRVVEVPSGWRRRSHGESKISGRIGGVFRAGGRILWTVGRLAWDDARGARVRRTARADEAGTR